MASRRQGGIVLIIVLGVLVLLALLATSFATLQSIEHRVTHNYTDEVRAKLVAQSGIDAALARLNDLAHRGWLRDDVEESSWIYFGATADESGDPDLATPLESARNPSFAIEEEHPQNPGDGARTPKRIQVEGSDVGLSGIVGGTYCSNGDLYSLKVLDAQSMINVNDGVAWGPLHSVSQNLQRLLNVLGEQPSLAAWKKNASDRLGDLILSNRPPGGYQSKWELLRLLDNDPRRLAAVANHLTTHSWRHPRVAEPVPLSAEALPAYPAEVVYTRPLADGRPLYRYGHGVNRTGQPVLQPMLFYNPLAADHLTAPPLYCAAWSFDALNPQWIEQVSRAPVNVNTASVEVLAALVVDIEGFFLSSRRRPMPMDIFYNWIPHYLNHDAAVNVTQRSGECSGEIGFLYRTAPYCGPGSRPGSADGPSAVAIAREIVCCRRRRVSPLTGVDYAQVPYGGPFRTWAQFEFFVDSLVKENGLIWDSRPIYIDYGATLVPQPPELYPGNAGMVTESAPITIVSQDPTITASSIRGPNDVYASGTGEIRVSSTQQISYSGGPGLTVLENGWSGGVYVVGLRLANYEVPRAPVWSYSMGGSYVQRHHGSQAAADALKANFNPNLHLNDLNPDRILHRKVDKTDLIVHSTELCFAPMGIFEIESLGRILINDAPVGGTALAGSLGSIESQDNRVVAKKLMHAVVKLYDAEYQTAQDQFYAGQFAERHSSPVLTTNNNRSIETGPEPDNGPAPVECSFDGYVALPTRLGPFQNRPASFSKPKGELWTSYGASDRYSGVTRGPAGVSELGEKIHAHFGLDHVAEFHADGASMGGPVGPVADPGEQLTINYPDRSEKRPGPYGPIDSPGRHRLCRSFTLPPADPEIVARPESPALFTYAPSDLRLDGAFVEPHSVPGYRLGTQKIVTNAVVSFWYKPHYDPETLGHIREMFSVRNYTDLVNPQPFSAYLIPSWHADEVSVPSYAGPGRRMSMVWCLGVRSGQQSGGGVGTQSATLNHEFEPSTSGPENGSRFHGSADGLWNDLRGHEWVHVMFVCERGEGFYANPPPPNLPPRLRIYVNGKLSSVDPDIRVHVKDTPSDYSSHHGQSIRLGGELSDAAARLSRNYYAYGTIDEFFYWPNTASVGRTIEDAQTVYGVGRYYKPTDSHPDDALFTSIPLSLPSQERRLAAASEISAPPGAAAPQDPPPADLAQKRILALQWTALAEDYGSGVGADGFPRLKPLMWDYYPQLGGADPTPLSPAPLADKNGYSYETVCELNLRIGSLTFGPYRNEGWSPVRATHAANATGVGMEPPLVPAGDECRFTAKLRVGPAGPNTILLATPVLDDVTVFYAESSARFLICTEVR
jgi:hypothetical protein